MLKQFQLMRSFARKSTTKVKPSKKPSQPAQYGQEGEDLTKIDKKLDHIQSTRRTIKKFEQRNLDKFTKNELKVMNLSFDEVTKQINNGQIDVKTFEAERIKRKLSQNFTAYEYESRLRNRLENLMLEIGPNIQFPWNFNHDYQPEEIKNLDTVYRIENILDKNQLESQMRQFIRGIVEKDFTRTKGVSEKHLVKRVKKNLEKIPDLEVSCDNFQEATFDFEIFNVNNIFAVDIEQNRRKNFFFDKCKIYDEVIEGLNVQHMIPKRLSKNPVAKLFIQFDINLKTDLDLKLLKNGEVFKQDDLLTERGEAIHKLKLEVMIAESKYQSLLNTDLNGEINSFRNYVSEPEVKIIDIDGFMKGNPLLKGMM